MDHTEYTKTHLFLWMKRENLTDSMEMRRKYLIFQVYCPSNTFLHEKNKCLYTICHLRNESIQTYTQKKGNNLDIRYAKQTITIDDKYNNQPEQEENLCKIEESRFKKLR